MMKAAIVHHHKESMKIESVPIPKPGVNEVLVKVTASGCCHTDVHAIDGDWPYPSKLPLTTGHEGVGVVVEVGSEVTTVKVGDRVGIAWLASACGKCEHCIAGWETLCNFQTNSGYGVDGAMREYAVAVASHVIPIPAGVVDCEAAPILCAGVTSYKGLKETETKPGQYCTIIGAAGGLGHLAVQYAAAMGMIPIAIDVGQDKLDFCKSLGAEFAFDAKDPELVSKINAATNGGSHGVLCLATNIKAFKTAIEICRKRGTVVFVGLPPGDFALSIIDIVLKRITIRGSIVGTRLDAHEAFEFVERKKVRCIYQTEKFENVGHVYDELRQGHIQGRIVIDFTAK